MLKYKLQINNRNCTEFHLYSSHLPQILIYLHLYLQSYMNILLGRRKRGYSFHQNILDYVPENISILNSYTSWTPLIKILPLIKNNGHTILCSGTGWVGNAGWLSLPALAHTVSPRSQRTFSPVTRTYRNLSTLQLNSCC